ncbi:glycosyltransferase [Campylobacter insulaenigrae]|uniref:glycosyltransferase n=1 Tax=Campylobacter insulaenigrae TaxID=260714 RepID=UPI002152190C|nr:glycosyltransferase [Campylobacter insulaenigrae]MCR6574037.1 glycosyltransferase [Campylobacter insulaenigrae]MCR6580339.1 glycosyltransferase [Campylobacter insulaenigrae]MCR6586451.1 glycosyltransferase [Campylobacter insulaenigrae]
MKLSIIIPFGLSKERNYIEERVRSKANEFRSDDKVEYIFVEGYSSLKHDLKNFIESKGHIYIKDESQINFFSQGKCRNLGASFANAKVITFLDVDCYISSFSLEKILNLIDVKNISQNINEILVLPVIYLSKEGSEFIYKQDKTMWDNLIQEDLITGKNTLVKFFSPSSTSSIIINKHKFLRLGGNDENFIGHGYEDFDLFARVLINCVDFEKMPSSLKYDSRNWNFFNFKGFRSWFSLLGYETCFYGIYMYHFWHVEPNQNAYMQNKDKNHKLFYKHLNNIKTHSLKPLQVSNVKKIKVLVLFNNKNYDFRDISVYMGEFIYKTLNDFFVNREFNYQFLFDFLKKEKITRILLDKNINNLEVIHTIGNFDFIYFEKGVLPNSWLFSRKLEENYNIHLNLNKQEVKQVKRYFLSLTYKEKKDILIFFKSNINNRCGLTELLYFLINKLYSFENQGEFYQVIIDGKKKFAVQKKCKSFYSLKSFVYKPYLYGFKKIDILSFLIKILGLEIMSVIISHTKFYRLLKKIFFNPKGFFEDFKTKRKK